ncbi:Putative Selenoprotein domain-containing protein [[Torrubiella] hemipterigena]|uniref:Putative Selenoprotein domain-containing protein n=1 Tax=[Torrubiella] hemipterigena TaxID=1531966 RepID=A0A0A1T3T0_9HYPO|nr:Putative Selenoprotein domain-containing protein [[Torrubiella] hemipterigena]
MAETAPTPTPTGQIHAPLPRIAIQFCTQCKWNLRAAYFAQELLSTFATSLGEVALQPATGGIFTVTISTLTVGDAATAAPTHTVLWDRKVDGGFPETKELKRRVRDVIDPKRDLGHVDKNYPKPSAVEEKPAGEPASGECQDCK